MIDQHAEEYVVIEESPNNFHAELDSNLNNNNPESRMGENIVTECEQYEVGRNNIVE